MMSKITGWFHSWISHPYGKGASAGDYVATALVLFLVIFALWKIIHEVRKA